MNIRRPYLYAPLVVGILLFGIGSLQAQQSGVGSTLGSGGSMGSGSINNGGSPGPAQQGHESSGRMGGELPGRTGTPNAGDAIYGGPGLGRAPEPSTTPGMDSGGLNRQGTQPNSGTRSSNPGMGSSGGTGTSGGMRSPGGMGSSGGAGGGR